MPNSQLKIKALVLFSGGLDSILAARVLKDQGIEVTGICYSSNFFSCERARQSAKEIGIPLIEEDLSDKILSLVKCPTCGYGKNLNPCIDCHSLMIKEAAKYLNPEAKNNPAMVEPFLRDQFEKAPEANAGFDFIATGEVLGQRPFSQNREALIRVRQLAGVEILRPLSASLLPETYMEKNGLVNRQKLLDIKGRSREPQMELADKFGIKDYPSPAGGCLLTDPEGSKKILDIILHCPDCKTEDVELLKHGRVFWLKLRSEENNGTKMPKVTLSLKDALRSLTGENFQDIKVEADVNFHWVMVIVGRNDEENKKLEKLAKKGDIVVKLNKLMGPTTLARLENYNLLAKEEIIELQIPEKLDTEKIQTGEIKDKEAVMETLGLLTGYYATKARGQKVSLNFSVK